MNIQSPRLEKPDYDQLTPALPHCLLRPFHRPSAECSHAVNQSAGISDILAADCSVRNFSSSSRSARSQSSRSSPCEPPRSMCISYARCWISSGLEAFCFQISPHLGHFTRLTGTILRHLKIVGEHQQCDIS